MHPFQINTPLFLQRDLYSVSISWFVLAPVAERGGHVIAAGCRGLSQNAVRMRPARFACQSPPFNFSTNGRRTRGGALLTLSN